jgi:hypothetical protein
MVFSGMFDLKSGDEQHILNMVFSMVSAHTPLMTALKLKDFLGSFTIEWE